MYDIVHQIKGVLQKKSSLPIIRQKNEFQDSLIWFTPSQQMYSPEKEKAKESQVADP